MDRQLSIQSVLEQFPMLKLAGRFYISDAGCWIYTYWTNRQGYGQITYNKRIWRIHRLTYELTFSKIPKGLVIDHLCRIPGCFNPWHLETVSNKENCRRGNVSLHNKVKRFCPKGHEYSTENTRVKIRNGWIMRDCRECDRIAHAKKREAKW